jgi:hypothetical protein
VAARLTFDPVGCAVWLDPPALGEEPVQQVCSIHAATLTVPLGWTVTDRRFEAPTEPEPDRSTPPEAATRPEPTEPEPEPEPEQVESEQVEGVPAAREPIETEPVVAEQVEGAPAAREPVEPEPSEGAPAAPEAQPAVVVRRRRGERRRAGLLDRALRSSGPQHSVLTQPSGPPEGSGEDTGEPGDPGDGPDAGS